MEHISADNFLCPSESHPHYRECRAEGSYNIYLFNILLDNKENVSPADSNYLEREDIRLTLLYFECMLLDDFTSYIQELRNFNQYMTDFIIDKRFVQ